MGEQGKIWLGADGRPLKSQPVSGAALETQIPEPPINNQRPPHPPPGAASPPDPLSATQRGGEGQHEPKNEEKGGSEMPKPAAMADKPHELAGPFVRTRSGARVWWDSEPPPLEDFLFALGRLPRFAGATITYWTVLQHSWLVYLLSGGLPEEVRKLTLIHDFAEIITGDIPSPVKPAEFHNLERFFLVRLAHRLGFGAVSLSESAWGYVHALDRRALFAEGSALTRGEWHCDPADMEALRAVQDIAHHPDGGMLHTVVNFALTGRTEWFGGSGQVMPGDRR